MVSKIRELISTGHREVVRVAMTKVMISMPESTNIEVVHLQITNGQGVWIENVAARDLDLALRMLRAGVAMASATLEEVEDCPCGALAKGAMHAGGCPEG
jgi:uracil phosphoribosyltransferase